MSQMTHQASALLRWTKPEIEVEDRVAEALHARFEIDLCERLLRVHPRHVLSLLIVGNLYTRSGRHKDALRIDRLLIDLLPEDPTVRYNLACSHSNLRQIDEAFDALSDAFDLGYRDFDFLERDPDLENLRRDPRFEGFVEERRSRAGEDEGSAE